MSFVVELNSIDGTGDIFNRTYMLDWSFFEDGEYELSYTFKSGLQTESEYGITTAPFSLALPDLVLKNVVSVKNSRTQSSNIVGQLSMEVFGTGIWYRSHHSNMPVRCMNPSSYEFRVQLLDITGDLLTAFEDYNLILYFNKK
jgi:hypothetical protein